MWCGGGGFCFSFYFVLLPFEGGEDIWWHQTGHDKEANPFNVGGPPTVRHAELQRQNSMSCFRMCVDFNLVEYRFTREIVSLVFGHWSLRRACFSIGGGRY